MTHAKPSTTVRARWFASTTSATITIARAKPSTTVRAMWFASTTTVTITITHAKPSTIVRIRWFISIARATITMTYAKPSTTSRVRWFASTESATTTPTRRANHTLKAARHSNDWICNVINCLIHYISVFTIYQNKRFFIFTLQLDLGYIMSISVPFYLHKSICNATTGSKSTYSTSSWYQEPFQRIQTPRAI